MHDPNQIHKPVSGDAVKADPALLNPLAGDSGAGEVLDKTPWRMVKRHPKFKHCVDIVDRDGNLITLTSPFVANHICVAVNNWTKLFGDCTVYRDVLRALQVQLAPIESHMAVKRALDLIETTLHPKDGLQ